MEWLKRIFTWWDGPTFGTWLFTRRFGSEVGRDDEGNVYYAAKDGKRRWVIYNGPADASKVPPGWRGWLQHNFELPPSEEPSYQMREWEKPHVPNLTGTAAAYRPRGSQLSTGERPAATGDYVPWSPDE